MAVSDVLEYPNDVRDTLYMFVGLCSVLFGSLVYRRIEKVEARRWTGTLFGVFVVLVVVQRHACHVIPALLVAVCLVKLVGRRRCHIFAWVYMLTYITIFRVLTFNENRANYTQTNLVLMLMTCKVVGVAFEVHGKKSPYADEDPQKIDPSVSEMLHFVFSYFGTQFGPYVRYRTYDDFIKLPFAKCSPKFDHFKNFSKIFAYVAVYTLFESIWPLRYALSEEFTTRSVFYKMSFAVLQFQRFKLWMYCGLVTSECICSAAGFGAYPVQGDNKCTHGPSKNYSHLVKTSDEEARSFSYDFKTVSNIDVYCLQSCPWVTIYTREWNKSIQYFMAMYVYRFIPKTKLLSPLRIWITIIVCAFWHGIDLGLFVGMLIMPMYTPTDRLYLNLYRNLQGLKKRGLWTVMYLFQLYVMGFGAMAFLLIHVRPAMSYYSSVGFLPYFLLMAAHVLGLFLASFTTKPKSVH